MTSLRKGQARLGPHTWAAIREAYLAGTSAAALAEAYGCSLGTIRYRAVREGWRRCDVAAHAPAPPPASACDDLPPAPEALADAALAAAMRAVRIGRPAEAAAYVRVAEAARRLERRAGGRGGWPADDDDYGGDEEPADIEQVYADLEERLGRLTAQFERKRAAELAEPPFPLDGL